MDRNSAKGNHPAAHLPPPPYHPQWSAHPGGPSYQAEHRVHPHPPIFHAQYPVRGVSSYAPPPRAHRHSPMLGEPPRSVDQHYPPMMPGPSAAYPGPSAHPPELRAHYPTPETSGPVAHSPAHRAHHPPPVGGPPTPGNVHAHPGAASHLGRRAIGVLEAADQVQTSYRRMQSMIDAQRIQKAEEEEQLKTALGALQQTFRELEKKLGAPEELEEDATGWEELSLCEKVKRIHCRLAERFEILSDADAAMPDPPVMHNVGTSPMPQPRKDYASAAIGPQTPRRVTPQPMLLDAVVSPMQLARAEAAIDPRTPSPMPALKRYQTAATTPLRSLSQMDMMADFGEPHLPSTVREEANSMREARVFASTPLVYPSPPFVDNYSPAPLTPAKWGMQTGSAASSRRSSESPPQRTWFRRCIRAFC
ncbi:hypothetical protein FA95DRAFT_184630 [Auriscalpium vulgare]|uniref:Uncharacterized protein n=1 Tax=Auriscalpium vulgare TaxID=40419 RepID=A0ACB8RL99_9AGAM|nr:hypothetical protein FA95DRAFT_184630 [Auriscalpium vulgare]